MKYYYTTTYPVKTIQHKVIIKISSFCSNADCDFCKGKCKSCKKISSWFFASQQFKKTGIKTCLNGGQGIFRMDRKHVEVSLSLNNYFTVIISVSDVILSIRISIFKKVDGNPLTII